MFDRARRIVVFALEAFTRPFTLEVRPRELTEKSTPRAARRTRRSMQLPLECFARHHGRPDDIGSRNRVNLVEKRSDCPEALDHGDSGPPDGSGDGVLQLPDDLWSELLSQGWQLETYLSWS